MILYQQIAQAIRAAIDKGIYLPETRLPGVRRLSQHYNVSISTIIQAQRQLENAGIIIARPRSGFYVTEAVWTKPKQPNTSKITLMPSPVTGQELVLQLAQITCREDFVQFGAAVPHHSFMPISRFQKSIATMLRQKTQQAMQYAFPPGLVELRQVISKRMLHTACDVDKDDIIITNGCQEALSLALQSVAKKGDIIAIESPAFYGLLQVIEALGLKALEIPTSPVEGMSLSALELALEQWTIKACVLTPNFSNPLGGQMSDMHKSALVALAAQHDLPLIEDDIYHGLSFKGEHPRSLLSFAKNKEQTLIYCSSYSKTISQGLRVGWIIAPKKLLQRIEYLKYVADLATPTLNQLAIADYLQQGNYDRHLHQIQLRYQQQVNLFTHAISKYFPPETRVTQPRGGFVLWVELPHTIDTLKLSHRLLEYKISITPGQIFSATQKYTHCIRLNCAQPWSVRVEKALIRLGQEALLFSKTGA